MMESGSVFAASLTVTIKVTVDPGAEEREVLEASISMLSTEDVPEDPSTVKMSQPRVLYVHDKLDKTAIPNREPGDTEYSELIDFAWDQRRQVFHVRFCHTYIFSA